MLLAQHEAQIGERIIGVVEAAPRFTHDATVLVALFPPPAIEKAVEKDPLMHRVPFSGYLTVVECQCEPARFR
jgi:hypothetical protein